MSRILNASHPDSTRLVEGSGSVQLPTNANPYQQVIDLVNRVADSRAAASPPVVLPRSTQNDGGQ